VIPYWAGGFLSRLQRGRFVYAQKTKPFTGPLQNGSVNLGNGNICYVSMNHFETATATK
jgi:hypothetical protein